MAGGLHQGSLNQQAHGIVRHGQPCKMVGWDGNGNDNEA